MEISECIYDELITQAAYEISLLRLPFNTAEIWNLFMKDDEYFFKPIIR